MFELYNRNFCQKLKYTLKSIHDNKQKTLNLTLHASHAFNFKLGAVIPRFGAHHTQRETKFKLKLLNTK